MNEIATALDRITDSGRFELLATAVLRRARPEFAAIIHTGVNAEGKSIPSPIDGIGLLPGVSQHFGTIQHTTCSLSELRRKWLGTEGDIAKAATLIREERQRNPEAELTLVLTSNRVPDETLFRDAHSLASSSSIHLDIWERTRLADFLQHNPDGQWLARKFLGVPQSRLSSDLLADISQRSAEALARTLLDDPAAWIDRPVERELVEFVHRQTVTFLSWPSGTGKTTAATRLLQSWLANAGTGLWIPAAVLEQALSLENAIDIVLHGFEPTLEPNAGASAVALSTAASPLLLIVDDVVQSGRPIPLLERLVQLGSTSERTRTSERRGELPSFRVVCPVWPHIVQQTSEAARRQIQLFSVAGGIFQSAEATAAVRVRAAHHGVSLTELQAGQVASALGNDPLLIAVAAMSKVSVRMAIQVIAGFVDTQVLRCSEGSHDGPIEADFSAALDQLAFEMLERRNFEPTWAAVVEWFRGRSTTLDCLRRLARQRTICHVHTSAAQEQFSFRHDRVRTVILARCIRRRFETHLADEIVGDPYFAEVIGASLVLDHTPAGVIERVSVRNPLALFHSLRVAPSGSAIFGAIVPAIQSWFARDDAEGRQHQSLRWAMQVLLADTDAAEVLEVASLFTESTWALDAARFRNGDVRAGANYCYSVRPGYRSPERDRLIQHSRARFGPGLVDGLSDLLREEELPQRLRIGALHLGGFLGRPELAPSIRDAWALTVDRTDGLPAFLWAGGRCCGESPASLLDGPMDLWANLPSDRHSLPSGSPHQEIVQDAGLQWAFIGRMPVDTLEYLISRAQDPRLTWPIALLLQWVDHPKAAEFVARHKAAVSREVEVTGGFSTWLERDPRWFREIPQPYTDLSRDRLKALWAEDGNDSHLRRRAFQLWCRDASDDDLEVLRQVGSEPLLRDDALRTRLELADSTAPEQFRDAIRTSRDPSYWWQFLRRAWLDDYEPDLCVELDRRAAVAEPGWHDSEAANDWTISELIMGLDEAKAEDLLMRNWDHLKYSGLFIQAALFVGTERCRSLVQSAVRECPDPTTLFKFLGMRWQMGGRAQLGRLTAKRLEAICPHISFLDESSLHDLWEGCNQDGFFDWRRNHLDHLLSDAWRARSGIQDSDHFAELDRIAAQSGAAWPSFWLEEFQRRGDTRERPVRVVDAWLQTRGTLRALEVAAACLSLAARRSELVVLNHEVDGNVDAANAIREDARFAVCSRTLD